MRCWLRPTFFCPINLKAADSRAFGRNNRPGPADAALFMNELQLRTSRPSALGAPASSSTAEVQLGKRPRATDVFGRGAADRMGPRNLLSDAPEPLPIGRGPRAKASPSARSIASLQGSPELSGKQFNAGLKARYQAINAELASEEPETFGERAALYSKYLKNPSQQYLAVRIANSDNFPALAAERLLLLWRRKPSAVGLAQIEEGLAKIDAQKDRLGPWSGLSRTVAGESLKLEAAPKKDQRNIRKKSDIEAWNLAAAYVESLASRRKLLVVQDILEIEQRLLGSEGPRILSGRPRAYSFSTNLLGSDDINYMYTFSKSGKKKLDPSDSFIPGASKMEMLEHFCAWFKKNRDTEHPVILAAQARQLIVSIHPFMDANGRLARQIANFILMQAGYPPAHIPQEPDDKNTSVALFPLKDFEDQISPDETMMLMIKGVLRAQRELSRGTAHVA